MKNIHKLKVLKRFIVKYVSQKKRAKQEMIKGDLNNYINSLLEAQKSKVAYQIIRNK